MTRATHATKALALSILIISAMVAGGLMAGTAQSTPTQTDDASTPSHSLTAQAEENGTVYVGSTDGELYAIDESTGSQEWSQTIGGQVRSSPTVAGGTVYVGSTDNSTYAIDAGTGDLQWSHELGDSIILSSPTVVGDTVYIGSADNNLYALDASTGDQQWMFQTGGTIDGSPQVSDGTVYIGSQDGSIYAVDQSTGTEEWSYSTGDLIGSSPTVSDGTVYFGSFDDTLYALDADTGGEDWTFTAGNDIQSSPTIVNGTVYFGSRDNNLYALDASTGTEEWSYAAGGSIDSSPTVSDGTVYVGSDDTDVHAVDAATGTGQWTYTTGGLVRATPTVFDGTVYISSRDNSVYALDTSAGTEEWSFATGGYIDSSPTIVTGGSSHSDGTRVLQRTLGHLGTSYLVEQTTGSVVDENGDPIEGATVVFTDADTGSQTTTQTGATGNFGIGVESGRYDIEISADGYQTVTETRDVEEGDELGTYELAPQQLDLQFTRFIEPGDSTPYTVEYTGENGTVMDVTGNVSINSSNTSVATVDTGEVEIVGQTGVNGTSVITANYTVNNQTYTDTRRVTVATKTVDNLEIIPGTWRLSALLDDITIQVILVAIGAGIIATRAASSWAGLGAMELVILIGWFGGWVPLGIALLGLFTALFIGLNLAANIDYSVRR